MTLEFLHPADQLVQIMDRIYNNDMTTTSGGNLSIHDDNGDIWITPSGIDKGSLTRNDICCAKKDGTVIGPHKPSIELTFHASVYRKRPDIRAILHAHPPSLIAFAVTRTLPNINLVANVRRTLNAITKVEYAVPGSELLGDYVSQKFQEGHSTVVMDNHGVVVGAATLFDCYKHFETVESLATLEISARKLGTLKPLSESEINLSATYDHILMDELAVNMRSSEEYAARRDMINLIRRCYRKKLFNSTQGTYSVRLSDGSFIITPYDIDRAHIDESDLVLIRHGMREQGKMPSRAVKLHQTIYNEHPEINSVIGATPPHSMAFAVTDEPFDPRTIPESYVLLRETKKVPYSSLYLEPELVSASFSNKTPVLICENNQILVTGNSLLQAFDRLEVMEATAQSIIQARGINELVHITDEEVIEIHKAFNLS